MPFWLLTTRPCPFPPKKTWGPSKYADIGDRSIALSICHVKLKLRNLLPLGKLQSLVRLAPSSCQAQHLAEVGGWWGAFLTSDDTALSISTKEDLGSVKVCWHWRQVHCLKYLPREIEVEESAATQEVAISGEVCAIKLPGSAPIAKVGGWWDAFL